MSSTVTEGTVLSCSHGHCGCRVVVQNECHCESEAGATYTCACGAPMVPVTE
jgi:hypothetical protein